MDAIPVKTLHHILAIAFQIPAGQLQRKALKQRAGGRNGPGIMRDNLYIVLQPCAQLFQTPGSARNRR